MCLEKLETKSNEKQCKVLKSIEKIVRVLDGNDEESKSLRKSQEYQGELM